jgi:aromatic ring hydroxylase
MPTRTGAGYMAGLRERAVEVYFHGERVQDMTTHPALRNGVRTLASLYDMQHDPAKSYLPQCHCFRRSGGTRISPAQRAPGPGVSA